MHGQQAGRYGVHDLVRLLVGLGRVHEVAQVEVADSRHTDRQRRRAEHRRGPDPHRVQVEVRLAVAGDHPAAVALEPHRHLLVEDGDGDEERSREQIVRGDVDGAVDERGHVVRQQQHRGELDDDDRDEHPHGKGEYGPAPANHLGHPPASCAFADLSGGRRGAFAYACRWHCAALIADSDVRRRRVTERPSLPPGNPL